MENLLKGFNQYKSEVYPEIKEQMEGLAGGQTPHTFLITCADSRISTDTFSSAAAGEVFVIRNAGNTVYPYSPDAKDSLSLTLEYGISALNIPEIVVCGHVSCGAMDGVMKVDQLGALPLVQNGLQALKDSFDFNADEVSSLDELIEMNVKQQLKNLMSYPFIKEKVEAGSLKLWGWVYDFAHGEIKTKISHTDVL